MYYKYSEVSKYVVDINTLEPQKEEGYKVIESNTLPFKEGDEFEFLISLEIGQEGVITSYSAIRQSKPAKEILRELEKANKRVKSLEESNAEMMNLIAMQGITP